MDTDTNSPGLLLLIEDDRQQQSLLTALMRRAGFRVLLAADGYEGLKRAREDRPDIILCDVNMPPPNGFLLKQWLDKDPGTAAIPFIFLTARDDMEDKLAGLSSGADDYITKPFHPRELIERVRAIMRRHRVSRRQALAEAGETIEQLRRFLHMTAQLVGDGDGVVEQIDAGHPGGGMADLLSRERFERQLDEFGIPDHRPVGLLVLRGTSATLAAAAEEVMRALATLDIEGSDVLLFKVGHEALVLLLPRTDAHRLQRVRERVEAELARPRGAESPPPPGVGGTVSEAADEPLSVALRRAEALAAGDLGAFRSSVLATHAASV